MHACERREAVTTLQCMHRFHDEWWTNWANAFRPNPRYLGTQRQPCPACRQPGIIIARFRYIVPQADGAYTTPDASRTGAPQVQRPSHLPPNPRGGYYPIFKKNDQTASYLVKTELPDGRLSIIVDPGAWTNLAGGNWIRNMKDRALKNGRKHAQTQLQKPLEVQGVGQGIQKAIWNVHMPIAVKDQDGKHVENTFEVPALEGQDGASVPALLGMRSMRRKKAVLDGSRKRDAYLSRRRRLYH